MARYRTTTIGSVAEGIIAIKQFLSDGGWQISDESTSNGRTFWACNKGGISHKFIAVENASTPWSYPNSESIVYAAGFGIASGAYAGNAYFGAFPIPFPLRMDMFELSGNALMVSFEKKFKLWRHLYSGALDKSIAGNYAGGLIFSGSDVPVTKSAGEWTDWVDLDFEKMDKVQGLFSPDGMPAYYRDTSGSSVVVRRYPYPYSIVPHVCVLKDTTWISKNSLIYVPETTAAKLSSVCNKDSILSSYGAYRLAGIGSNALSGMPSLTPFLFSIDTVLLGALADIFICPMDTVAAGGTLILGDARFIVLPFEMHYANYCGMAVRCN